MSSGKEGLGPAWPLPPTDRKADAPAAEDYHLGQLTCRQGMRVTAGQRNMSQKASAPSEAGGRVLLPAQKRPLAWLHTGCVRARVLCLLCGHVRLGCSSLHSTLVGALHRCCRQRKRCEGCQGACRVKSSRLVSPMLTRPLHYSLCQLPMLMGQQPVIPAPNPHQLWPPSWSSSFRWLWQLEMQVARCDALRHPSRAVHQPETPAPPAAVQRPSEHRDAGQNWAMKLGGQPARTAAQAADGSHQITSIAAALLCALHLAAPLPLLTGGAAAGACCPCSPVACGAAARALLALLAWPSGPAPPILPQPSMAGVSCAAGVSCRIHPSSWRTVTKWTWGRLST